MNITKLEIDYVKGIEHLVIDQVLYPNRPNILVAPNGFGKSSIASAFLSLKRNKIELNKDDYYCGNNNLESTIIIETSTNQHLVANKSKNEIGSLFNIFVVNCQLHPTAKAMHFGKIIHATASIDVSPTVIYNTIPQKYNYDYNYSRIKSLFGENGKILYDIKDLYDNVYAISEIERKIKFEKLKSDKVITSIDNIRSQINHIKTIGNADLIKKLVIEQNICSLDCDEYNKLSSILKQTLNLSDIDCFLATWQYLFVRQRMGANYKKTIKYSLYLNRKAYLDKTLDQLNPVKDRFKIVSKETKNKLIIEWPKASSISSGQRDILVFIAKLMECEFLATDNCILIIDEFFDYLDDANVVAFQYYVSTLIESFKKEKRLIFPILLTHLDPSYLKHFCFNDKKLNVCYLSSCNRAIVTPEIKKLIINRDTLPIKDSLDSYYFHFNDNIQTIDLMNEFIESGLNIAWSSPVKFKAKINRICRTYLCEPDKNYDPLAVCCSVRIRIEENIYNKLSNDDDKRSFIEIHTTKEKLLFAQSKGIIVPETYFLLGIVYNHPLHTVGNDDISKPLGIKLDNFTIKQMITELW